MKILWIPPVDKVQKEIELEFSLSGRTAYTSGFHWLILDPPSPPKPFLPGKGLAGQNPGCMVTPPIREQRKTHLEALAPQLQGWTGTRHFDSDPQISTEMTSSLLSSHLPSGAQSQLCGAVNLQPYGSFQGSFPGPSIFLGIASSRHRSRWAQEAALRVLFPLQCSEHPTYF